jgi:enamine deaminase RidA (YjgF/YER057c/UK114 family)
MRDEAPGAARKSNRRRLHRRTLTARAISRRGLTMAVDRVPGAKGASFSKAVAVSGAGRTVYVSGHLSPEGSMTEQANGCFDQIEAALRPFGGSLEHVVRITAWLISLQDYTEYSSAAMQVAGLLQGASIEIDAVAFIPD